MTDSTAQRWLGRLAAGLAVLVVVVLAARTTDDAAVTDVLAIPEAGSVRAEVLENGTPVFVVHAEPEEAGAPSVLDVIQAFSTEAEGPITELVGWCAASQQFTAPHLGPLYDRRGRRVPTSTAGRLPAEELFGEHTALDDLIQREVTRIEGRDQPEDPIVVGGVQQLQDFQVAQRPAMDPTVPPDRCRLPDVRRAATADQALSASGADGLQLLHHGFLATEVDAQAAGWQITSGWLQVQPDGAASWCDARPDLDRSADGGWVTTCAQERPDVLIGFPVPAEDVGGVPLVIGGPLAARLHDGVVQRLAVLPDTTWEGASLRGTEVVSGTLTGYEGAARVLLLADADGAATCRGRWPTGPAGASIRVPVGAGPPVSVQYGRVGVVVDAVTCRALRVEPQD